MLRRPAHNCRGFTLIEILCVVVILGIASALIIPQIGSRDDLKVAAAARVLISDLMYAQNLAISQQRQHFVNFDGQRYSLQAYDTASMSNQTVTHPITKNPYVMVFGTPGSAMAETSIESTDFGGDPIIGFDELGSPFRYDGVTATPLTATARVTLRCGNMTLTVSIEPFTGETSVQ